MKLKSGSIPLETSKEVRLNYVKGEFVPFKGFNPPKAIKVAMVVNNRGNVKAYSSEPGIAFLKHDNLFELRGVDPKSSVLSVDSVINDLNMCRQITKGLEKHNQKSPLMPVGYVRYLTGPQKDGCCCILQSLGNVKVSMSDGLSNAIRSHDYSFCKLVEDMAGWQGFYERIVKKQGIKTSSPEGNSSTMSIYLTKGGFGACPLSVEIGEDSVIKTDFLGTYNLPYISSRLKNKNFKEDVEETRLNTFYGKKIPRPLDAGLLKRFFS